MHSNFFPFYPSQTTPNKTRKSPTRKQNPDLQPYYRNSTLYRSANYSRSPQGISEAEPRATIKANLPHKLFARTNRPFQYLSTKANQSKPTRPSTRYSSVTNSTNTNVQVHNPMPFTHLNSLMGKRMEKDLKTIRPLTKGHSPSKRPKEFRLPRPTYTPSQQRNLPASITKPQSRGAAGVNQSFDHSSRHSHVYVEQSYDASSERSVNLSGGGYRPESKPRSRLLNKSLDLNCGDSSKPKRPYRGDYYAANGSLLIFNDDVSSRMLTPLSVQTRPATNAAPKQRAKHRKTLSIDAVARDSASRGSRPLSPKSSKHSLKDSFYNYRNHDDIVESRQSSRKALTYSLKEIEPIGKEELSFLNDTSCFHSSKLHSPQKANRYLRESFNLKKELYDMINTEKWALRHKLVSNVKRKTETA